MPLPQGSDTHVGGPEARRPTGRTTALLLPGLPPACLSSTPAPLPLPSLCPHLLVHFPALPCSRNHLPLCSIHTGNCIPLCTNPAFPSAPSRKPRLNTLHAAASCRWGDTHAGRTDLPWEQRGLPSVYHRDRDAVRVKPESRCQQTRGSYSVNTTCGPGVLSPACSQDLLGSFVPQL